MTVLPIPCPDRRARRCRRCNHPVPTGRLYGGGYGLDCAEMLGLIPPRVRVAWGRQDGPDLFDHEEINEGDDMGYDTTAEPTAAPAVRHGDGPAGAAGSPGGSDTAEGVSSARTDHARFIADVVSYLSIQHRTLPLHDHMGVNLSCAGCALLARLEAAAV